MNYCYFASPVGTLLLANSEKGLRIIGFPVGKGKVSPAEGWVLCDSGFEQVKAQLLEYFKGDRTEFELELDPSGTSFQLEVLDALSQIPFGETRSYRDIAEMLGRPKAVRAVGAANGRNPLPIVIPCHRVIGADGSLTGFGGGLPAKVWLLTHEGATGWQKGQQDLFAG